MYNKIFTKILDSSIWLEAQPTRIVWVTLIAAMDETGFCAFSAPQNLANRAIVSLDEALSAIHVLESPDANSADPDNEGRRIERVPGGWMVLNSEKYRELVTKVVIQEQTRKRVQRHREKKRNGGALHSVTHSDGTLQSPTSNAPVTPSRARSRSTAVSGAAFESREREILSVAHEKIRPVEKPMTWSAYSTNCFRIAAWQEQQPKSQSEGKFEAAFVSKFQMSWTQWNEIRRLMEMAIPQPCLDGHHVFEGSYCIYCPYTSAGEPA